MRVTGYRPAASSSRSGNLSMFIIAFEFCLVNKHGENKQRTNARGQSPPGPAHRFSGNCATAHVVCFSVSQGMQGQSPPGPAHRLSGNCATAHVVCLWRESENAGAKPARARAPLQQEPEGAPENNSQFFPPRPLTISSIIAMAIPHECFFLVLSEPYRLFIHQLTRFFCHRGYVPVRHGAVMRRSLGKTSGTVRAQQSAGHPYSFYNIASVSSSVIAAFLST